VGARGAAIRMTGAGARTGVANARTIAVDVLRLAMGTSLAQPDDKYSKAPDIAHVDSQVEGLVGSSMCVCV